VGNFIITPLGETVGSDGTRLSLVYNNMNEQKSLYALMVGLMFMNALQANLGM